MVQGKQQILSYRRRCPVHADPFKHFVTGFFNSGTTELEMVKCRVHSASLFLITVRHLDAIQDFNPLTIYLNLRLGSIQSTGVTSDEFWTILGAADDLSWVVFHYAGAAGAVGQVSP